MSRLIDLTGKRVGNLTVVQRAENDKFGNTRWICRCDCGKTVIRHGHNLRDGKSLDCGCGLPRRMSVIATKHGGKGTRLYSIWIDMNRRCNDPKAPHYENYGGRGIRVCVAWSDFAVFREWANDNGYDDRLTIDRIDNNEGYSPENCRWTTIKTQENNRRNNTLLTLNKETRTLSQWAEITGIHRATISRRIFVYGWPVERALTEPVRKNK